eukprot:1132744-Pelagomonas_calceolata.AAC.2
MPQEITAITATESKNTHPCPLPHTHKTAYLRQGRAAPEQLRRAHQIQLLLTPRLQTPTPTAEFVTGVCLLGNLRAQSSHAVCGWGSGGRWTVYDCLAVSGHWLKVGGWAM